jgi:hypothetical protein
VTSASILKVMNENTMQQPTMTVDTDGNKIWRLNGKYHREDGPAFESEDGYKAWYLHGELHREDGPAFEYANGTKAWYLHGKLHREDGPAVEYANGTKAWWLNDRQYEDVFAWAKALLKLKGNNNPSEDAVNDVAQQVCWIKKLDASKIKDSVMKETIAQQLKITEFPFVIKDKNNNQIYFESLNGYWFKKEYDDRGNEIHFENSDGFWAKNEYDDKGNIVYYKNSYKNSANVVDRHSAIIEMTFKEIADKLGIDAKNLRIKE